MVKKIISILSCLVIIVSLTGCEIKRDTMEDIEIYTTNYPIEFITKRLYGDHSKIHSIYPNGIDISDYKLTNKQIKDYSKADLYIYNGLSNEKKYIEKMRAQNKNLKIIDTTLYMEYTNGIEELWLDPSNLLMMAQNVKAGFKEYINNYYLNNDIKKEYEKLKIETSNLDAKIKQTVTNANRKTIIVSDDVFKFLEKYGLTVYSLDPDTVTHKTIEEVRKLLINELSSYIFIKENQDLTDTIKELMEETGAKTLEWHMLSNITDSQKNNNLNYFDLMTENIETLKNELYK